MPIIRLLHVKVAPDAMKEAERIWKEDCAPLMIKQPGCLSEKLLKCLDDPGDYVSYSEWESDAAIEAYRKSKDHDVIMQHSRNLQGARAHVKRYQEAG